MMRICKYGEPVLKEKAKKVENFDESLKDLVDNMVETMNIENGLGLAAPQVGVSLQVFIIDMLKRIDKSSPCKFTIDSKEVPLELSMPLVAVNPKIKAFGEYDIVAEEGCLSFPGIFAEVLRAEEVELEYFDLNGTQHTLICDDLFARCVQHEYDHLKGKCFVDHLKPKQLFQVEAKLKKLRRQSRDFLKSEAKNKVK